VTVPRRIVLDELDREGRVELLDDAHATALDATRLVEVRPERSGWRLLPRGTVGATRLGDLQVEVRPKGKVGLTRLLFLLGYARDPGFRPEDVAADPDADLWPALAESLVRLSRAALGPGVLQGYRTVDEALRTVRGRIRISDQLTRRPGRMLPIEVTHDEFTVDIAENRILRTALRRMLAVPRLSAAAQASLGHLDGQLGTVGVLPPGAPLPQWRATRLNQRYVPALRLAEIVLANTSAESGGGPLRTAAFVVDMARVYEDFVGTALTEALSRFPGGTRTQYPSRLDLPEHSGPAGIQMFVDVVHLVAGQPRLVFDAKYKAADAKGLYPNADHYQMLAYCTALGVPTAWLVYAGGASPVRRRIVNTGITVVEYQLDLTAAPAALLAQVNRLAESAWLEGVASHRSVSPGDDATLARTGRTPGAA
jgi:5-methylcytosine-specific restriction enzyme subunit McrC